MRKKDLALRVLSTVAIMSIVSSIAAPAFAGIYYIGNDDANLTITANANGTVTIKHGDKTYEEDGNEEIVIKGEKGTDKAQEKTSTQNETTTIGESSVIENEETTDDVDETFGVDEEAPDDADTEDQSADATDTESVDNTEETGASDTEETVAEESSSDTLPEDEADGKDAIVNEQEPVSEEELEKPTTNPTAQEKPTEETAQQEPPASAAKATEAVAKQSDEDDDDTESDDFVSNIISVVNNWVDKVLNIRLDNVKIDKSNTGSVSSSNSSNVTSKGDAAMSVSGSGKTKIELDGDNVLKSGAGRAGLEKNENGQLTITDTDGTKDDRGSLAAGIGGGKNKSTDGLTIEGTAKITATGGDRGAGIGSGANSVYDNGNEENAKLYGKVTIGGDALVTAESKNYGAGIGGGEYGGADVTITGNAVIKSAKGYNGIGTGRSANDKDSTITINDHATVNAEASNDAGAGIGGGTTGSMRIFIRDYAKVKAKAKNGAAIGGQANAGSQKIRTTIEIGTAGKNKETEGVEVTAESQSGSALGCGNNPGVVSITNVLIQGGTTIKNAIGQWGIGGYAGNASTLNGEKSSVKILDDAHLEKVQGSNEGIMADDITIGGDTGKVKLDDVTSGSWSAIDAKNTLQIGKDAEISMTVRSETIANNYGFAKVGDKILGVDDFIDFVKDGTGKIACSVKNGESTMLQYIAHGEAGCNWVETDRVPSTCKEKGHVTYTCKLEDGATNRSCKHGDNGGHTKTEELAIDPDAHTWNAGTVHEATCTEEGYTEYTCTNGCGATKKENVTPALDHDWGEWTVTKEASCTEDGAKERVCKRDPSHVETDTIAAKGHTPTVVGKKDPTETEPGYTGDTVCGDCGETLEKGEVIPATGKPTEPDQPATPDTPADDNNAATQDGDHVTAPELDVLSEYGVHQFFTVSQNGGTRTYTSQYDCGTLTGAMSTLEYLQEEGTDTIVFTTNQRTSRFAVADLLALVNEGDTFYLRHTGADDPTLLVIESDHSEVLGN